MNTNFRAAAGALVCAAAFGLGAQGAQAKTLDIVIAGDSYSSGVGGGGYTTECIRSPNAFGQQYAQRVRATGVTVNVKNVACGGAVVANLDEQIKSVTPETDLVVMTIGGNDVGFANIVVSCFLPAVSDPARCKDTVDNAKAKVGGVQSAALKRLDALKARARPGIKVVVASYPYLANPGNYILRGLFNSYNAGAAARQIGDLGDQAVTGAAAQANAAAGYDLVTFAPSKDLFLGHEPNQDPYKENPNRWVHEVTGLLGPVDFYHPNPKGHAALAEAVWRVAGPDHTFGVAQ